MKNIMIDTRIGAYTSFYDHGWAKQLSATVEGSKLEEPTFSVCISWKAAANNHRMPWLLVESIRMFWDGVQQSQPTQAEQLVWHLARNVTGAMGDSLSHMNRMKLGRVLTDLGNRFQQIRTDAPDVLERQPMFDEFLNGPGASELQLGIWGSQRTTFGAVFHAYENFVTQCVAVATGNPEYRPFSMKHQIEGVTNAFGKAAADDLLDNPTIDAFRLVRNAFAHHGGREKSELKAVNHGIVVVGDELQVMPADNARLFNELKVRVSRLVDRAITLPRCK